MIDKDIKRLEGKVKKCKNCASYYCNQCEISYTEIKSIENVLKELERYKQYYEEQNEVNKKFISKDKFDKVNSELEKYKKAYELETYERQKFIDELETYKKIVGEIIEETANGMKYLYVDTSVKDEGKYEAYMDIRNVLEKYKIID